MSRETRIYYELRPTSFSVRVNKMDFDCFTHMHEDMEILYMRSGTQKIMVDGSEYEVHQGEAAVIFPNSVHKYLCASEPKPAEAVLIICSSKFYHAFLPDLTEMSVENPVLSEEKISGNVKYAFGEIDKTSNDHVRTAWTVIIMTDIIGSLELVQKKKFPVEEMSYKIIKYIEENFTEDITRDTIAEEFSVSRSYVTRIFSEQIRMSFRKYLGVMRAEYATKLMWSTPDSLTVIAEKAGFESQRTFNRIFKEIYEMTPKEFRNNIRKTLMDK